jgi:hypothetical protein
LIPFRVSGAADEGCGEDEDKDTHHRTRGGRA